MPAQYEVSYQQIRDSSPDTTYVDNFGEYWHRDAIVQWMKSIGLDDWMASGIQFYAYTGPLGESNR